MKPSRMAVAGALALAIFGGTTAATSAAPAGFGWITLEILQPGFSSIIAADVAAGVLVNYMKQQPCLVINYVSEFWDAGSGSFAYRINYLRCN